MPAENFNDVVNAAVNDIATHGSNVERIAYWQERLRRAAEAAMTPQAQMQAKLDEALRDVFARLIDKREILKLHPGVGRFTIERLRESLRAELAKRIAISADLIVLNKRQVVEETMRRFSGWASSVPSGGSKIVDKKDEKDSVKKGLASLPFIERRVLIDQGHKLTASLNDILAKDGGAIAAHWISHAHQEGYDYRKEHLKYEEDSKKKPFVVRDNWAITRSLMKLDGAIYTDQIEQPAELPFCRCRYVWVYDLTDLPAGMITQKGRAALEAANKAYKERANAA